MHSLDLPKLSRISGTLQLPGSKSLSNRALLLSALAAGTTTLTNSSTTLSSQFTDADQVDSWAVESMAKLNNNGLMSGSGNTLSPKNNTSVQEAITLILALYNKF